MTEYVVNVTGTGKLNAEDGARLRRENDLDGKDAMASGYRFAIAADVISFNPDFFGSFLGRTIGTFVERRYEGDPEAYAANVGEEIMLRLHIQNPVIASADTISNFIHGMRPVVDAVVGKSYELFVQERKGKKGNMAPMLRRQLKDLTGKEMRLGAHALG